MKQKIVSLALALALCLGLSIPAFAAEAGDTTVTDANGAAYQLSNPILKTAPLPDDLIAMSGNTAFYAYVVPEGTVVTPHGGAVLYTEDGYSEPEESYTIYGEYYWPFISGESAYSDGVWTFFTSKTDDTSVSVTDSTGLTYSLNLSKPIFGTVSLETRGEENTFYQIPLGTVITPEIPGAAAPDGWYYNLPNEENVSFMVNTRGGNDSGDGSYTWWPWTFLEDIQQPLKPGTYQIECRHNWSTGNPGPGADAAGIDGVTEYVYFQVVPVVTAEDIPAGGTAYASTQTVTVDGQSVEFQMYALLDENGNPTNYIKLRDLASVLNGTNAQFYLYWDGMIKLYPGGIYDPDGSEMSTPFSGDRAYAGGIQAVQVDEFTVNMTAITLTDDNGGDYNYFKLRDLGAALGFNVGWSADVGAFIETDKPYSGQ